MCAMLLAASSSCRFSRAKALRIFARETRSRRKLAPQAQFLDEFGPSIEELETKLERAIANEEYEAAAALRDKLEEARMDGAFAVEHANKKFYDAFMGGDVAAMAAVWGEGDHVQCIHPSASCIAGRDDVLESWRLVLRGVRKGLLQITLENKRTHVTDTYGYITCREVVDAGDSRGRIVATNIFEKQAGFWKLVHHHASPEPM